MHPGIVECSNGDLIASWYGDTHPNDSAVQGARKRRGMAAWDAPFVLADRPGFPDCNTAMNIDGRGRLWLFWPTILGGSWESSLLNYQVATNYLEPGPPRWDREAVILLKPADFSKEALRLLGTREIRPPRGAITGPGGQKAKLTDPLYQRLGWAPRCKPTILPSGRIILPVYSDTFSISIMALSDDEGTTWYSSSPLIGFGNIQPTVLRRDDATLVAYMRENGRLQRIRVSESKDDGLTWGAVKETDLPNPGSGIDGVRLANGHWVLMYNDSAVREPPWLSRSRKTKAIPGNGPDTSKNTRKAAITTPQSLKDATARSTRSTVASSPRTRPPQRPRLASPRASRSKGSSTPRSTRPGFARRLMAGSIPNHGNKNGRDARVRLGRLRIAIFD